MWSLRLLPTCLVAAVSLAAAAQDPDPDPRFHEAAVLDSLGKHDRALKIWTGLATDPALRVRAWRAQAVCELEHLRKKDEAFEHIRQALAADPTDFWTYVERAAMYEYIGMPDRATDDLLVALPLAKDSAQRICGRLNLGASYQQTRRLPDALAQYEAGLKEDSTNVDLLLNKSSVLDELGQREGSLAIMQRLLELHPDNVDYMNNIGFVLNRMDRYAEAAGWFSKGLAVRPDDAYLLNNRGYATWKAGDAEGALKDVQRSIKVAPGNAYAYRNLGLIQQARGKDKEACDAFEKALAYGFTEEYGDEVKKLYDTHCH